MQAARPWSALEIGIPQVVELGDGIGVGAIAFSR